MHYTESVIIRLIQPNKAKKEWLENTANNFSRAVQIGLDVAETRQIHSRNRLHEAMYHQSRAMGLPSGCARMAVNVAVSLIRSYHGMRKTRRRVTFPSANRTQGIGLGCDSYKIVQNETNFVLRISKTFYKYLWFPLCVPAKYSNKMAFICGDAKMFQRGNDWYVMFPLRIPPTPTRCSGEPTFIGVDLGIIRHATVVTPERVVFFSGKSARHHRTHLHDLRSRYQKHRRVDKLKDTRGREGYWTQDINHKISRAIVDMACQYTNPVIVLECLDGIQNRGLGSKRFNRMVSTWTFRQLTDFIIYKAARAGVGVVFCDPRGTSKTCPKCGHATRSNRPEQGRFRCVSCGYQANADYVAARNIAAAGPLALSHGRPDTARSNGQTEGNSPRPDGVKGGVVVSHRQTLTS